MYAISACLILVFLIHLICITNSEFTCAQLDYLFQTHQCCESLGNSVPCLNSLPKTNFDTLVQQTEDNLQTIQEQFMPFVPRIINKNLSTFCHNDVPIVGGIHYNEFGQHAWYNTPDLYCNENHNRLVIIPRYQISNCYIEFENGGVKYTAKLPYNPKMTIESYHKGLQSKTMEGFCNNDIEWNISNVMKVSEINYIVQLHHGIIYRTEAADNHQLKFPCTSDIEKIIGNDVNRVNLMPLCADFQYLNQIDCENALGAGAWDHSLPLKMKTEWHTIDLHKEQYLDKLYFTRASGSSYLRFCLTTEYDNPDTYVNGFDFGFDNSEDSHKVDTTGR